MATAGKVAPTPKDKFVNGTAYDKLDVVEYNGTLYIAKKASAGIMPTDPEYWMLAVDLTGKLDTTGDTENNTVTFTSADETDPTAWENVTVMSSKEKHSSLLNKISTMFSNVRYLYKLLGTTDISALGTVTQALANLDGNVGDIKGIISSLADCSAATVAGYAADALAVKELNSNFNDFPQKIVKRIAYGQGSGFYTASIPIQAGTDNGMYLLTIFNRYEGKSDIYLLNIFDSTNYALHPMVKNSNNMSAEYDGTNLNLNRGTGDIWMYSLVQLSPHCYNTRIIVDWT